MMGMRTAEAVLANRPVKLLDGTPATFAAMFKATLDLPINRMLIVEADKPHEVPCIMCEEVGSEYTILLSMAVEDDEGDYEEDLVWAVHQKHFESTVDDGEENLHGS